MLRGQNFTKISEVFVHYECLVVGSGFTPDFAGISSDFLIIWEKDSSRWLCCGLESFGSGLVHGL